MFVATEMLKRRKKEMKLTKIGSSHHSFSSTSAVMPRELKLQKPAGKGFGLALQRHIVSKVQPGTRR